MLTRRMIQTVLPALLCALTAISAAAQEERPATEPAPRDITFRIGTKSGETVFRIGELVPLELSFTSSDAKKYVVSESSNRRQAPFYMEQILLEPQKGWTDPLEEYFSSFSAWGGSFMSRTETLEKPALIPLLLNEWVRFDSPGRYRLRLKTHRVYEDNRKPPNPFSEEGLSLISNDLELTIVPATKVWQAETLRKATGVLESSSSEMAKPFELPRSASLDGAVAAVRHLGTKGAAQEMVRRLGESPALEEDFSLGLIAFPDREFALKAMQQALFDPAYPVSPRFLSTHTSLSLPHGQTPETLQKLRNDADKLSREQLWEAISRKQGPAKAVSLATAITASSDDEIPAGAKEQLADNFDQLPLSMQKMLIEDRWDLIKTPEILPVLRKFARQYKDFPVLNEWNAYDSIQLSGAALQHWYELAPDEARQAILEEMLRPKPRFNSSILGVLRDKTLPEIEFTLVERLESSGNYQISGNLASLLERYGTDAILPRMLSLADVHVGHWECEVQEPVLAYLLRADPESARARIEAAIAARGEGFSACNRTLLVGVAKLHFDPLLQEIADKALWDDDSQVAGNAADFLRTYGSAKSEEQLWKRFDSWAHEWRGRAQELQFVPGKSNPNEWQDALGRALAHALSHGQGWLADPPKLEKLAQLSIDDSMLNEMESVAQQWRSFWFINCYVPQPGVGSERSCSVLQYQDSSLQKLKEKLAQFPAGSKFKWFADALPKDPDRENVFRDLQKFVSERGMSLEKSE